jgi:hypothetical protein
MKVLRSVTPSDILFGGNSLSKVILYVKSIKTVIGTVETQGLRGFRVRVLETATEPKYDYVLSEDQQEVLEMVNKYARRHDVEVEVVDVTRENVLRRALQEEREKMRIFPTLTTDSGRRIEGKMTEEQIESFLSRIANETRKRYL